MRSLSLKAFNCSITGFQGSYVGGPKVGFSILHRISTIPCSRGFSHFFLSAQSLGNFGDDRNLADFIQAGSQLRVATKEISILKVE